VVIVVCGDIKSPKQFRKGASKYLDKIQGEQIKVFDFENPLVLQKLGSDGSFKVEREATTRMAGSFLLENS
jgi:hypothetical protein